MLRKHRNTLRDPGICEEYFLNSWILKNVFSLTHSVDSLGKESEFFGAFVLLSWLLIHVNFTLCAENSAFLIWKFKCFLSARWPWIVALLLSVSAYSLNFQLVWLKVISNNLFPVVCGSTSPLTSGGFLELYIFQPLHGVPHFCYQIFSFEERFCSLNIFIALYSCFMLYLVFFR